MARALELAARGLGSTNPNPLVGSVIVKHGTVVGEGFHEKAGGPHAEVVALEAAGPAAQGATLYVNLEPCSHQGRTPPCAPLVATSGIRRVVVAMTDPNRVVAGRGLGLLRRRGLEVAVGVLEAEARRLNARYVTAARKQRPYVLLKAGVTLDGRIATAAGDSKWITSPAQRKEARRLRGLHDAVVVGVGTVLADDPLLLPEPRPERPFHRIVFDSDLRLPLDSRLVRSAREGPVVVLGRPRHPGRRRALEARGVTVLEIAGPGPRVDVPQALKELRRRGLWSVMVEGGAEVLGSFVAARAFDHVALFRAPLLLGGRRSLPAFGGPDPRRVAEALPLVLLAEPERPLGMPGPEFCEVWAVAARRRRKKMT